MTDTPSEFERSLTNLLHRQSDEYGPDEQLRLEDWNVTVEDIVKLHKEALIDESKPYIPKGGSVSDVKPFVHGEEGTHSACDRRLKAEGGQAKCCYCSPHKDCELLPTPKNTKEEEL
jgi:hypothetical protein